MWIRLVQGDQFLYQKKENILLLSSIFLQKLTMKSYIKTWKDYVKRSRKTIMEKKKAKLFLS
jgi:hypothetical protein